MIIYDKIRDEKFQYDINREAAKISALSWGRLININILQAKHYYLFKKVDKKVERCNNISLVILL